MPAGSVADGHRSPGGFRAGVRAFTMSNKVAPNNLAGPAGYLLTMGFNTFANPNFFGETYTCRP